MKKYYAYSYPIEDSLFFRLKQKEKQKKQEESQKSKDSCHPVVALSTFQYPKIIRQYTFTCEQDFIDIKEGFCPSYAVYWLDEHNRSHWPEGTIIRHRPEYLKKKEEEISSFLSETKHNSENQNEDLIHVTPISEEEFSSCKNVRFDLFRDVIPIFDYDDCSL
jgi:hypothetical protein